MAVESKKIVKVNGRNRRPWALASKERILEAATAEIAAVGFERARLTDIAARAEMTPGSIYTWFENKEDLFRAALEEALTKQIISNAETLDAKGFTDNWIIQIGTLVPRNSRDTKATDAQMLLIESYYTSWRDPKARKKLLKGINSHLDMYVNIIKNAQSMGRLLPTSTPRLSGLSCSHYRRECHCSLLLVLLESRTSIGPISSRVCITRSNRNDYKLSCHAGTNHLYQGSQVD